MIGRLNGVLLRKSLPAILLDVGGVGYEVRLSLNTFEALPAEGRPVGLEVVTLFRSDALELYGFQTSEEKSLFNALLGVGGVGPRTALSLLSALAVDELVEAVQEDRPTVLERVPGIGRKTAHRVVLELRDKLKDWTPAAGRRETPRVEGAARDDAVAALVNLGYRRAEAEKAVGAALRAEGGNDLAGLLRLARRRLGREA